ncbi:uncharacterized protein LOC141696896 [Apium graveolens]|uniref:uncharacterized protein LOC141696896 n=1 Tax=Apium graveolens TaxID=4045 RepID=UPI003D79E1FC
MVKKSNDKWRMCVDYTDLNDVYPKDPYPLPNIDQLIDTTSRHKMLSFMDAFFGYNQIKMNPRDKPKTAFITHRAVHAYVMLPFGLTSEGSTYQRAMNKIFKSQIGRNLECYVDDMISKSITIPAHVEDLKEFFDNLRKNQLKLNPEKCTFGVGAGKTAIKAQALADFIIECSFLEEEPEPMNIYPETNQDTNLGAWPLKVDGSSTSKRSGAELILKSPERFNIQTAISFGFPVTKNQAEYEALIAGLKLSKTLRVQYLKLYNDSQIVVKQTNGDYIAKDPILEKYQALVQSYLASIPKYQVPQICREENEEADILSKLVRNSSDLDCSVYFEELHKPSIDSGEVLEIENNQNWMTHFINYLEKYEIPEDKGKAQRLKTKAAKFFIEEGLLYRRTLTSPILQRIGPEEAKYYLMEVHEGICGDHMSANALAHKIIRQGYY